MVDSLWEQSKVIRFFKVPDLRCPNNAAGCNKCVTMFPSRVTQHGKITNP